LKEQMLQEVQAPGRQPWRAYSRRGIARYPTALADFLAVPRRSGMGSKLDRIIRGETCDLANESEDWSGKPIRPAFVELGGALTML
jgi:hypothetical protein